MPSAKEKAEIQNIHKKWPHEGDCNSYEKALFALIATTRREALEEAAQLTESPRYCGCFDFRQCETCAWIATERERCAKELRSLAADPLKP